MNDLLESFYKSEDEKERVKLIDLMLEDYTHYLELVLANVIEGKELRSNAYLLNLMSKKKRVNDYLKTRFNKNHFDHLVNDEDAKCRKNLYIFMGNFLSKEFLMDLIKALRNEKINYCISSLILTLGNYHIKNIDEIMNKYLDLLNVRLEHKEIEKVHYEEIVRSINKVLNKNVKATKHTFIGFKKEQKLLLTCMKPLINASLNDIKKEFKDANKFYDGVVIKSNDLDKVYKIRTFYEALIMHDNCINLSSDLLIKNIRSFLNSNILSESHLEKHSFSYRIEYISSKNKSEKINLYNKVNEMITKEFKDKFYNNPSYYEFEIRIIDNENNNYDVFYKLCTYIDNRYNYRKRDLPASINPVSAAIMLNEVSRYLKENSSVLDPFCGTATMLIERSNISNCKLYGVDINKEAIEYATTNSKFASKSINLYCSNCLNHIGSYDEIISNMPYGNRVGTHLENEKLYGEFIDKLPSLLNDGGVAILLTSEISLIKRLVKGRNDLKLVEDIYTETGGLTPHLFVIKKV